MKTMLELPDLAAEAGRIQESKRDFLADTRNLTFYVSDSGRPALALDTSDGTLGFPLNAHAEGQIASRLKVPKRFWDRLIEDYPDELVEMVRAMFVKEHEERMLRTLDGKGRAFLSNRYRRIDNVDILTQAIVPAFSQFPEVEIRSAAITDTKMHVKATFPNVEAEIRVGEIMRAGVAISNSEVGAGGFNVSLFTEVLLCTNGMIGEKLLNKTHTGSRLTGDDDGSIFSDETLAAADKATMLEARDLILSAADSAKFEALVASCRGLTEIEVEAPAPKAVEELGDRHDLTETEQESILDHLIRGGDFTAWGYTNAVTRTAEDADDYERATELERLGGKLVELPAQDWRFN